MKFKVPKGITSLSLQGVEHKIVKGVVEAEIEIEFLLANGFKLIEDGAKEVEEKLTTDAEEKEAEQNDGAEAPTNENNEEA